MAFFINVGVLARKPKTLASQMDINFSKLKIDIEKHRITKTQVVKN